ncbi:MULTISPECIES: DoxX-like family protein [Chitinophagaceae]
MTRKAISKTITILSAFVWLINGVYAKILDKVPRHEEIVGRILGKDYERPLIFTIGILEALMAIWIFSGYKSKLNVICQIVIVLTMNLLEFVFAKDLLLWGKWNALYALIFAVILYVNEFRLKPKN